MHSLSPSEQFTATLVDSANKPPALRSGSTALYRECNQQALIDSIFNAYPLTRIWCGDQIFSDACSAYCRNPSQHWDLNRYPLAFTSWLQVHRSGDTEMLVLAAIEAQLQANYYHHNPAAIDQQQLTALSEEQQLALRWHIGQHIGLYQVTAKLADFLNQHKTIGLDLTPDKHPQWLIISRLTVFHQLDWLSQPLYAFIEQLRQGCSLGFLLDSFEASMGCPLDIQWLSLAIERQWITSFTLAEYQEETHGI
ncbi:hypothetical protein SIN8267_02441 [Sinobacterium norvegicum]|uniref:Putative DNA-binding domain-containing protein n=1 Tax=Sinobacterium norvegicum TaxID=1641715 RepID=A0ABN8ELN7_9GAMM|nr:putative DNA-binding domain-containing protein [Sinobacterium norvegicum]CAH0992322.1 hypothetical protein SIN8267_02441 [Sinobacterium norvegicum]